MEDVNLSFLLWIIDQRSMDEMKGAIEKSMGLQLHQEASDRPLDERLESFEVEAIGLFVSLRRDPSWTEGNLYRFAGGTKSRLFSTGAPNVSIDSHLARALVRSGISQVMSREQFIAYKKARQVEP